MNNTLSHKNDGHFHGFSAFTLKLIALICMTLDHIAAIGFEIPVISRFYTPLRTVGRIAAPLFLFLLVESICHTRSRKKLLLRLWLAGLCTELFTTGVNAIFGENFHYFTPSNILFTFFYTVLFILLAEKLILSFRKRDLRHVLLSACLLIAALLPTVLNRLLISLLAGNADSIREVFLCQGLIGSFFPAITEVDYGVWFILLGAALYFAGAKKRRCVVFAAFCLLCIAGTGLVTACPGILSLPSLGLIPSYFTELQCCMLLALPFMLLYNGERGPKCKWFFYFYYPLHREVLFLLFSYLSA